MSHIVPDIIPAILVHSEQEARDAWTNIADAEWVQLDCLNGSLVPNTSYFDPQSWPVDGPMIELHIMTEHPRQVIESWMDHPLCKRVVWHIEAHVDHEELLRWCHAQNLEAGIAINPDTSLGQVFSLFPQIDLLLLLGVQPGWSGQPFIPTVLDKIRAAHASEPTLSIGIDGGVTEERLPELVQAGVTHFYVGSQIFRHEHRTPADALQQFTRLAHDASIL